MTMEEIFHTVDSAIVQAPEGSMCQQTKIKAAVLCVDDDPQIVAVIRDVLCSHVDVFEANNLEEGRAMVLAHHPALVIVDRMIGNEDGRTLVPFIQQCSPKSKVMVLSAYPGTGISRDSQPEAYMVKPVSPADLLKKVEALLN